ncbi:hypothetical protein Cgig2_021923 [Carnegiea gigantea]|uniref:Aminotransferase-like plant mobile domain-containing protein n=1 Tax=Carnegiea gigantea TaxID=171969 RepID=A0A9Q1GPN8_9CARY|nr:hypothetical protein Cgig2_021923 [Carnegiea gigantea]
MKGKEKEVAVEAGEKVTEASVAVVIQHRCTLKAVCALNDKFDDDRKRAIRDTMSSPVLEYRSFVMNGHLVWALIECWNSDTKSFKIRREVPFSVYDVTLITGLPVHGKLVSFQRSEASGEVEELLKGIMDSHVSRERRRRRTLQKDMRMYRNYISVLLELCRSNNTRDKVGIFTKLYALLVVSGLLFPRCAGGVAWDLISMVEDVKSMAEHNWAEATWMFLVEAMEEGKEKMRSAKYINPVLEVREEESVKDVVRAFIDTDEYQGYVEDAKGVISLEVRLRDVLRKEKKGHAATKKELAAMKKELAKLKALIQAEDGRANVSGREMQAGDERVVELMDDNTSLIHHSEDDDGVVCLSPHVRATEAGHEHGKLEARHASLDDTKLHSDAVENEMDVGHGTSNDLPGANLPRVGKGKRKCAKLYTSRKRSRKEVGAPWKGQAVGPEQVGREEDVGNCGKVIEERQSAAATAGIAVGSLTKACLGQHERETEGVTEEPIHRGVGHDDVGVGRTHSPIAAGSSHNDQGPSMTKLYAEMISFDSNIHEACEEEVNLDPIALVGPTVVE